MADSTRQRDAIARALRMAQHIAQREDVAVRERIERFKPERPYAKRDLCIAEEAWAKVVAAGIEPRLVFARPDVLTAIPKASLHYRGIALLSRKRVQEIAGVVTPTMRIRLEEMRIEDDFDIEQLLHDEAAWARFLNEVFHHALRLAPEVATPPSTPAERQGFQPSGVTGYHSGFPRDATFCECPP